VTPRPLEADLLLVVVIVTALAFDFTNGFHDTANAMATSIATRAMRPRRAVGLSAALNFAGAFISIEVATTIAEDIVDEQLISLEILFAGLVGAILWNLATWAASLPSSSSHALIGGVVGAALVARGGDAVNSDGLFSEVIIPAVIAPLTAGVVGLVATFVAYRIRRPLVRGRADRGYRLGQLGSASLVSLAHGTNDAQKTMGIIVLALIAHGSMDAVSVSIPLWVKLSAATAIAVGTYMGGWRIIRTLGKRVTGEVESPRGFAAETSAGGVILASSYYGFPLSTTHVTSGAVIGSGLGKQLAKVRWGLAARMVTAWLVTLPAAGAVAALAFELSVVIGAGFGALLVGLVGAGLATFLFLRTQRRDPVTAETL
jgi:PiT family inorganic phosphate transporter